MTEKSVRRSLGQDKTGHGRTGQGMKGQHRISEDNTGQKRTKIDHNRAGQYEERTGQTPRKKRDRARGHGHGT